MIIRKEHSDDQAPIYALVRAAFGRELEARLVELLRSSGDSVISLVAIENGEIVGHVMLSRAQAELRALALGPLAVHPACQRRGIGSALVCEALEEASRGFWEIVFLLGNPNYYRRFGFDAALASGFNSAYAGPHFMAYAIDKKLRITQGAVAFPRAFAELGA